MITDMAEGIVPISVRFFMRVEDIFGIENVLYLTKERQDRFAELLFEPRSAHQAVIVFAG